jgi:hypothetical protein
MQALYSSDLLTSLADDFALAVPAVDAEAEHDRWQAGIGPFDEDKQVEMLREAVEGDTSYSIETEDPVSRWRVKCRSGDRKQLYPATIISWLWQSGLVLVHNAGLSGCAPKKGFDITTSYSQKKK